MAFRFFRISITILVLWFLFSQLEWSGIIEKVLDIKWWIIIVAIGVQILVFIVGTGRWWVFFYHEQTPHTLCQLINPYFVGALFNNVLPSATGGDTLRIYHIYKQGYGPTLAVSPIVTERIIGLWIKLGIASSVIPFIESEAEWIQSLLLLLPAIFFSLTLLLFIIGWPKTYRALHNLLAGLSGHKLLKALLEVAESTHGYLGNPTLILQVISLSILAQFIEIIVFFVLAYGADAQIPFTIFILAVPLILIISGLSISIGGLGVREAAAVTIFSTMGMSNTEAATVAFLFIPTVIIGSLPGLYFFLTNKDKKHLIIDAEAHSA